MSEIEIKPSSKDDFLKSIKKEIERQAEILKNLKPKAFSWELSKLPFRRPKAYSLKLIKRENEKQAAFLKILQPKAISWKLSQKKKKDQQP